MSLHCPKCSASLSYIRSSKGGKKRWCTRCGYEGKAEEFENPAQGSEQNQKER